MFNSYTLNYTVFKSDTMYVFILKSRKSAHEIHNTIITVSNVLALSYMAKCELIVC